MNLENNKAMISGKVAGEVAYSHEANGIKFYSMQILTRRSSGAYDIIPVIVSEKILDKDKDYINQYVLVTGMLRSRNTDGIGKKKVMLYLYASEIEITNELADGQGVNLITLDGHICKDTIYRETSLGKEITDMLLAVNRSYGKSDYIPCICWGSNARLAGSLEVGSHVSVSGRIQSREYRKRLENGEFETRTTYEVSVNKIKVIGSEE